MKKIPGAPAIFCGRDTELDQLGTAFLSRRVILLHCDSGYGKTSLALTFANQLNMQDSYLDQVIWVTCKPGWTISDLAESATRQIFQLLGKSELISTTAGHSSQSIIEIIEKNCLILFIDNLHLLPDDVAVSFAMEGVSRLDLGRLFISTRKLPEFKEKKRNSLLRIALTGLDLQGTTAFLNKLAALHCLEPIEAQISSAIHASTSGHPFAVKLLFNRYLEDQAGLQTVLSSPGGGPEAIVSRITAQRWHALSPEGREVLEKLAILRASVGTDFLSDNESEELKKTMRNLVSSYLVENDSEGNFYLHVMIREFV
ncbi:MAG: AAA family ATPase, partial [Candidatus Wallbacteria bacterium]|nr:AAA family ATPase [Candidatus Wallbacteria bacterium]